LWPARKEVSTATSERGERIAVGTLGCDGKPDSPTPAQISDLIAASELKPATEHRVNEPVQLAPHELAIMERKT
jgi:hypothetical protein